MLGRHSDELLSHFDDIVRMALTPTEWAEREASDMFQSTHFCGGFEAVEDRFTFSYYPDEGGEFWFDLSLSQVEEAASTRELPRVELRLPS